MIKHKTGTPSPEQDLSDQEIVEKLLARDNRFTEQFFYVKCRPLFCSIIRYVFNHEVEMDEFVNMFYVYLMKDGEKKLRTFQYRCSFMSWIKLVATRFFIEKRDEVIDNESKEPQYEKDGEKDTNPVYDPIGTTSAGLDVDEILSSMRNQRYAYVIRKLVIEEVEPIFVAKHMGITTANLYNIKKRALAALAQTIAKDKKIYEKERY